MLVQLWRPSSVTDRRISLACYAILVVSLTANAASGFFWIRQKDQTIGHTSRNAQATTSGRQASEPSTVPAMPERVSLISIIANPQQYFGKSISIVAYSMPDTVHPHLYLHKEDFDKSLDSNSIPAEFTDDFSDKGREGYFLVDGTFEELVLSSGARRAVAPMGILRIARARRWP